MRTFSVCGRTFEAGIVVFDKDGLLFKSEAFWRELMQARVRAAEKHLNSKQGSGRKGEQRCIYQTSIAMSTPVFTADAVAAA